MASSNDQRLCNGALLPGYLPSTGGSGPWKADGGWGIPEIHRSTVDWHDKQPLWFKGDASFTDTTGNVTIGKHLIVDRGLVVLGDVQIWGCAVFKGVTKLVDGRPALNGVSEDGSIRWKRIPRHDGVPQVQEAAFIGEGKIHRFDDEVKIDGEMVVKGNLMIFGNMTIMGNATIRGKLECHGGCECASPPIAIEASRQGSRDIASGGNPLISVQAHRDLVRYRASCGQH